MGEIVEVFVLEAMEIWVSVPDEVRVKMLLGVEGLRHRVRLWAHASQGVLWVQGHDSGANYARV